MTERSQTRLGPPGAKPSPAVQLRSHAASTTAPSLLSLQNRSSWRGVTREILSSHGRGRGGAARRHRWAPCLGLFLVLGLLTLVFNYVGSRTLTPQTSSHAPQRRHKNTSSHTAPRRFSRKRQKGSVAYTREELDALPPYAIPEEEARDVFLKRPNWRRGDPRRAPYVFDGSNTRQMYTEDDEDVHTTFRFTASGHGDDGDDDDADGVRARRYAENVNAEGAEDPDVVRVLIVAFNTFLNEYMCNATATAFLSGLPLVTLGYRHAWNNFTDRHFEMQIAAHRAGLRPQDVILFMDGDILFSSGPELSRTIDRFIRYSPESADELDPRDVRDDAGAMMAPILFSAERKCKFFDYLGFSHWKTCVTRFGERGMNAFDQYMKSTFPEEGRYRSWQDYVFRFLNSGTLLARMWAYDEFVDAMKAFIRGPTMPYRHRKNRKGNWTCDQSLSGALFLEVLRREVELDIFRPFSENEPRRLAELRQKGPYGLRPGLIAIDYYTELVAVITFDAFYFKINDRYWRAAASEEDGVGGAWGALRAETGRLFALSFAPKSQWRRVLNADGAANTAPDAGGALPLTVSERYFSRRTTASDGLVEAGRAARARVLRVPEWPFEAHCVADALYHVHTGAVPPKTLNAFAKHRWRGVNFGGTNATAPTSSSWAPSPTASSSAALLNVPNASDYRCHKFPEAPSLGYDGIDWFAQPRRQANGGGREADLLQRLLTPQPLRLSRTPAVTSIAYAPQTLAVELFFASPKELPEGIVATRPPGPMEFMFPAILHPAGSTKLRFAGLVMPLMPWAAPLFFGDDHSPNASLAAAAGRGRDAEGGFDDVKRFLSSMELELWGDDFRTRKPFKDVCMPYVDWWFMDRRARAVHRPYGGRGTAESWDGA